MSSKKELLEKLANCVVEMEDEEVVDVAKSNLLVSILLDQLCN